MAKLINGNGNPAVYAAEDADLIASLAGNVTCIANVGSKMVASQIDANTVGVADGVVITKEGRRIQLDAGLVDSFIIPTGQSGVTNYYIIGYKLSTATDSTQTASTFVQKMANDTDVITEDTFRGGATDVYVSLYRVKQVGMNIDTITGLLPELSNVSQLDSDIVGHTHREMTDGRTCAQIFGALATAFSNLTEEQKRRAILIYGNTASNNRATFKITGFSGTDAKFSTMDLSYLEGTTTFITSFYTITISTVSANCGRIQLNMSGYQTGGSNIVVNSSAIINYSDTMGSVSDTHYYELVY